MKPEDIKKDVAVILEAHTALEKAAAWFGHTSPLRSDIEKGMKVLNAALANAEKREIKLRNKIGKLKDALNRIADKSTNEIAAHPYHVQDIARTALGVKK